MMGNRIEVSYGEKRRMLRLTFCTERELLLTTGFAYVKINKHTLKLLMTQSATKQMT